MEYGLRLAERLLCLSRRNFCARGKSMKRLMVLAAMACAVAGAHAQAVETTVCAVLKNPRAFDGRMVRIKGIVVAGLDQFVLNDGDCGRQVNSIWLAWPQGAKARSGPLAMLDLEPARNFAGTVTPAARPPVTLQKDKAFRQFDSALAQQHRSPSGLCLACPKYDVQATITGRLDGVDDAAVRRENGKIAGLGGFGNANAYAARLVIQSVSDVTPKEIDYSRIDSITKQESGQPPAQPQQTQSSDPLSTAQKLAGSLAPSPVTTQIQKDIDLLGKPRETNGVMIGFGAVDEISAGAETPASRESPGGVRYNCTFNRDRLPDEELSMALLHLAQHISDLRDPQPGNDDEPLYIAENNAWAVTATMAVAAGERFLTLPGGYLMWDASWPDADKVDNMVSALDDFLSKEALLSK
jgi:hypothetical protein